MRNYLPEVFEDRERELLAQYFTNVDGPVFCLQNLPEELKAALFARYSRSDKSLRRIFLDEFAEDVAMGAGGARLSNTSRTRSLMRRVIGDYGDDSVAQLAVAHVAVEQVSTVLTRMLERHRLLNFLEQSTRYVNLGSLRADGSLRVVIPEEFDDEQLLRYRRIMSQAFGLYAEVFDVMFARLRERIPESDAPRLRAARAAALDIARGCLPMATMTNVGIVGSAQGLEYLVIRLRSVNSHESLTTASLIAHEVEKVLGLLVERMERPDRGGRWTSYLEDRQRDIAEFTSHAIPGTGFETPTPFAIPSVRLLEFQPRDEDDLLPWMLYESSSLPFHECQRLSSGWSEAAKQEIFRAYVGDRNNRRHKPSRAWEMGSYTFEVETDYGSYRDLARHRLLTLLEQDPVIISGYQVDPRLAEAGLLEKIDPVFDSAFRFAQDVLGAVGSWTARMALPLASRVRFVVRLNARELLHIVELRSQPQGHPVYRRIVQEMYSALEAVGHRRIAGAMQFVDLENHELGRAAQEARGSKNLEN